MKKTILTIALFAAPLAFGAINDATTMDQDTVSSGDMHFDTNSNSRFDNRDTRTNSLSTPASMGADRSQLDPDVTSNKYVDPMAPKEERMSGSSTVIEDQGSSVNRLDSNGALSGSGTEAAPSNSAPAMDSGAAAAGATTSTTETTTTTKTKKVKKSGKSHHKSGSSSMDESTAYPSSSSSNSVDSNSRDARTGSSTSDSGSGMATGAAAGAAAGAEANKAMSSDSSYNKKMTAQDTSNKESETELVRKIRAGITDNKDLSVNAHNIKIISQNGQIILKGQVADANEKMKVEEIAKRFAGNARVMNQTMIDSRSGSSTNK